jgi:hypothetical protein
MPDRRPASFEARIKSVLPMQDDLGLLATEVAFISSFKVIIGVPSTRLAAELTSWSVMIMIT